MDDATDPADEGDLWVDEDRQPLGLHFEADVSAGVKPDAATNTERETREADVRVIRNVGRADAGHYEWFDPRSPLFDGVLVAEISVILVQDYTLPGRVQVDVFPMARLLVRSHSLVISVESNWENS